MKFVEVLNSRTLTLLLCGVVLTTFGSGCSLLKANPAKQIYLLKTDQMMLSDNKERAPFNGYWVKDPVAYYQLRKQAMKIYIAPVRIDPIETQLNQSTPDERRRLRKIEETQEIARYFRERVRIALANRPDKIVEPQLEAAGDALSLELALVEVDPTNPAINILGTVAGFLAPGGGLVKRFGTGSVAFEGLIRKDTEVLEQFRDREKDKESAASLKDYQRFAHIRTTIDEWSDALSELLNTPPEHRVEDSLPFTLNPF